MHPNLAFKHFVYTLQIVVKQPKRRRLFALSNSLQKLGRSVARRKFRSVASHVLAHKSISKEVIERVAKVIAKEMNLMCRRSSACVLNESSKDTLATFTWNRLIQVMKVKAPNTSILLEGCVRQGYRWKKHLPNTDPLIGIVVAIILRLRSQKMNLIQRIVAVVLYAGHAAECVSGLPLLCAKC